VADTGIELQTGLLDTDEFEGIEESDLGQILVII
jgi:hypothetical protein